MQDHDCEQIERAALLAAFNSVGPEAGRVLGLQKENIHGVLCFASRSEPSILLNRCFGLGVAQPASPKIINSILAYYKDTGVREFFLHLTPDAQPDDVCQLLLDHGMQKSRGWMKFVRDMTPPELIPTDLKIEKIAAEHAQAFAQVVLACFDLEEASLPLVANLYKHPDYLLYGGFSADRLAATGCLFIQNGVAYYDWAATHRDFRQRGYQGAILRHLIRLAIDAGCHKMVTATGEAVAGDAQHSYKNILRAGFREHYLRENWTPAQKMATEQSASLPC